jgi:hypothetical protein
MQGVHQGNAGGSGGNAQRQSAAAGLHVSDAAAAGFQRGTASTTAAASVGFHGARCTSSVTSCGEERPAARTAAKQRIGSGAPAASVTSARAGLRGRCGKWAPVAPISVPGFRECLAGETRNW